VRSKPGPLTHPAPPGAGEPQPQPELREPRLGDPGPLGLSLRDYRAIAERAVREALQDNVVNLAQAIAYNTFLAIPSALLVAVGVFATTTGPGEVSTMLDRTRGVLPADAVRLLDDTLRQVARSNGGGVVMIVIGGALALWSLTGAMQTVMWALNTAYERRETRGFLKRRLTALAMVAAGVVAFLLVFVLLVLGPAVSTWVGDAMGAESAVRWVWWVAEWPVLVVTLLAAFGAILYLGPDVDHPRYRFLSFGALFAVVTWIAASGAFAVYVSGFASYNKAWGSLAAVIVMLTWLWLGALALLLGAEINAEAERSRELRTGQPASRFLQAPPRG
jgi:membrane protein